MASYSVSVDPDAQIKIEKAAKWYDLESPDPGDKFRDRVNLQLNSLNENPRRHAIKYRDVRCVSMKHHPYTIHYIVENLQRNVRIHDFIDDRQGPNHQPRRT